MVSSEKKRWINIEVQVTILKIPVLVDVARHLITRRAALHNRVMCSNKELVDNGLFFSSCNEEPQSDVMLHICEQFPVSSQCAGLRCDYSVGTDRSATHNEN